MIQSVILLVVLIGVNAIFASAEIAVISVNETKLKKMAEDGDKRAKRLQYLVEQPSRFLSTIQVAITMAGFLQGAFAVGAGLVFGYVAVEYSIGWSILIHVLNNLVFSDLLGRLAGALPETAGALLEYGVSGAFFLAACVILVRRRKKLVLWWRQNRPPRRYWLWAFTTFWVILFLLMETVVALDGVGRL